MPKFFLAIASLMRLDKPIAYLLIFFPCLFGLFLAWEKPSDLWFVMIFLVGSLLTRSAGCIINDLFDQDFDKHVQRTRNRPLASKQISNSTALIVLIILLVPALLILLTLSITSITIGLIAFCMIVIYPLMKRFTYFPQAFLGTTWNLGCLIAYAAIKDTVSFGAFIMYIACGFWTFGYDSIYAFMDLKDDKVIGVKSSAVFLEHKDYKLYITFTYLIFTGLYIIANILYDNYPGAVGGIVALPMLLWQTTTLDITDMANCTKRFRSNMYVGIIMSLCMGVKYILY